MALIHPWLQEQELVDMLSHYEEGERYSVRRYEEEEREESVTTSLVGTPYQCC